jgi:hypothetical protein
MFYHWVIRVIKVFWKRTKSIYRGTFFNVIMVSLDEEGTMETTRMFEAQPLVLRFSPCLVGVKEAWLIGKTLHVSPAVFQLLTDEEDRKTAQIVINQITIESHSFDDLSKRDENFVPARPLTTVRDVIIFAVVDGEKNNICDPY